MTDTQDEARATKWRCPRCRFWVNEPIAKYCALCKECIQEAKEESDAVQCIKTTPSDAV